MRLYLQNAKSELPIYHYNVPIVQKKERRKKTRTTAAAAANRTEERWWFAACRPDNRVLVFELRGSSSVVSRRWMLRLRVQVFASGANLSWGFLDTHSQADSTNHHQRIPNAAQSGRQQGSMRRRKKVMFLCHVVMAAPSGDPLAIHVRRLLTPGKDKASIVVAKEVPVNRVNEWVNVVEQNGPNFNPDYCWGHTRRYLL